MSPELITAISGTAVVVLSGVGWLVSRAIKKESSPSASPAWEEAVDRAITRGVAPVTQRLDTLHTDLGEMSAKLDSVTERQHQLERQVAVHEWRLDAADRERPSRT